MYKLNDRNNSQLKPIVVTDQTRKLSYRKDDRAMRPIYECPEKFRESLTMPTATFPEIFNGVLSLLPIDAMNANKI